jgi:hypothetical protein
MKALIWLDYINKKVELGLIDKKITADIFYLVLKLIKGDVALIKNAALLKDAQLRENKKVYKTVIS